MPTEASTKLRNNNKHTRSSLWEQNIQSAEGCSRRGGPARVEGHSMEVYQGNNRGQQQRKAKHSRQAEAKGSGKGGRESGRGCVLCLVCWRSLVCREVRLSCLARRRLWECSPLLLRTIRGTSSCTPHHTLSPHFTNRKHVCYYAS